MELFCFNCGSKLQEKFTQRCVVCGIKFNKFCQNCSFPIPSFANFCPNCGSYITKSSEYFRMEELKKVAVMFADVSGFTKFSENLSPDEVRKVINEFFEFILRPVYNLNGTVDKFIGDCALILFWIKKYSNGCCTEKCSMCNGNAKTLKRIFKKQKILSYPFQLE